MASIPAGLAGLAVKSLVGAVLVSALCFAVDLDKAAEALGRAGPVPLGLAAAASVLGVLVSAAKWRGLLRQAGIALPLACAARLYWFGMFVSNFLPTSVGGDAARVVLTPSAGRHATVAGTILVERLTGFLVMLALCTLGLALRPQYFDEPVLRDAFLAVVLALDLAVILALVTPRRLAPGLEGLARRLPAPLGVPVGAAARVAEAVAALAADPAVLGRAMAFSACFYGTIIVAQHGVLHAVGAPVPLLEVALVAAVVPLFALLPVSLNGLGLAEGVFVVLYTQVGVDPEVALAAALLRRLVDLANSGFGGLLWLACRETPAREERRPAPAAAAPGLVAAAERR